MTHPKKYRRSLHRIPELGFDLPQTTAFVKAVLAKLPCAVFEPAKGAVAAFFDAGKKETFAFRADMDGLPVSETTGTEYSSCHAGAMHACGHDGHTAALLSFAEYLTENAAALNRNALLIFEPAEETTGGAKVICESGIFEKYNVKAVFGVHLWPGLEKGRLATCGGGMMACSCEADITFFGKSSHIAKAAEGADALEAASRFLCRAYDEIKPQRQQLLKFGFMEAGTVRNALADKALLRGSLRATSKADRDALQQQVRGIAQTAAAAGGCTAKVTFSEGYPPVENDPQLTQQVFKTLGKAFDIKTATPAMTAEDFSFYQEKAPVVFFWLGLGETPPLHAANFDFDDEVLKILPEFYAALLKL